MELLYLNLLFIDIIGGGSGRLFELFGGITIRYTIFFIGLFIILYRLSFKKINLPRRELFALILGTLFIPIGMITMSTNDLNLAINDIKPFLFFILLILILSQNDENSKYIVTKFSKYLIIIPLVMGILQILLILCIQNNIIPFQVIYAFAETKSGELMFRGEDGLFFYKGFFFLGVGCVFSFIKKKYWLALFLMVCLYLTQTRGLLLATIFSILLHVLLASRKQTAFIFFIISPIVLLLVINITSRILNLREDVGDSNSVRFMDAGYILENNNIAQTLIGNGWGAEIRDRPKLENVYMEIFFKSGVFGLLSSLVLVFYMFTFKSLKTNPYFYLMIFAFTYSQTNPFILTPMGIILTGICILSCRFKFDSRGNLVQEGVK